MWERLLFFVHFDSCTSPTSGLSLSGEGVWVNGLLKSVCLSVGM